MKGCFILQRQFAYIGHHIALHLKERYGVSEFCAYTYLRSSNDFLASQEEIRYSPLMSDEEVHEKFKTEKLDPVFLKDFEERFGIPFLWPFLKVDRVLMSNQLVRDYPYDKSPYTHEELLRILQVHAKAILSMLEKEKPDFLFCSVIGGVGALLLYRMAKKMGIKTFVVVSTCLRDRWLISENYENFSFVDPVYLTGIADRKNTAVWKKAEAFLEEFRKKPIPYFEKTTPVSQAVTRRQQFKFLLPVNFVKSVRSFFKATHTHFTKPDRLDYSYISPWNSLKDKVARKIRNAIGNEAYYDVFDPNIDFAFFPLHYEPEVSLLLQAPYRENQIRVIQDIARSLPVQFTLYVKEHPVMAEYRPQSFYKELKKIHNVKLIRPSINSFSIIPHAKLVTTITGTVGWEAVLLKKPVISFGHQFYNSLSMVEYCHDTETLPLLVKKQLQSAADYDEELIAFIASVFEDSVETDLQTLWNTESDQKKVHEGLRTLADLLAKKLEII
ncbi:MAG: hypothetical protein WC551_04810 [Patescibacteria group bacterium]